MRALFVKLGNDDFNSKINPNGSNFSDALVANRIRSRFRFPVGIALTGLAADPDSSTDSWLWHNYTIDQP